jgi:hypothetical protein
MSVYKKLQEARVMLHHTQLNKSGKNKFANFNYFELGDFIPQVTDIFNKVGLCGVVSFTGDTAYLTVHETEGDGFITFTSPLVYASVEKTQPIQNLGSTHTYLRRYLWLMCMEITENDVVDSVEPKAPVKFVSTINKPTTTEINKKLSENLATYTAPKPTTGPWALSVSDTEDVGAWMGALEAGCDGLLAIAVSADDVATIFKTNRSVFDKAKSLDETAYSKIMEKFTATKKSLIKA